MNIYGLSGPWRTPAWFRILLCLTMLPVAASSSAQAQSCCALLEPNSIFVHISAALPGTSGFNTGVVLEKFDSRFDATGDGVADLATIVRNENGSIESIEIVDVKNGEPYLRYELANVFVQLMQEGWTQSDIIDLQVVGFFDWLPPNSTLPKAFLFRATNGMLVLGDGNALTIGDGNGLVVQDVEVFHDPPSVIRLLGLDDYDNDGVADLLIGNKTDKVVWVASSKFAPGG